MISPYFYLKHTHEFSVQGRKPTSSPASRDTRDLFLTSERTQNGTKQVTIEEFRVAAGLDLEGLESFPYLVNIYWEIVCGSFIKS